MKKNGKVLEEAGKKEEELLDFEFEELLEDEGKAVSAEASSDKEVIELVDVIEMGEMIQGLEYDKTAGMLGDRGALEKPEMVEEEFDLGSDEFIQTPDEEATQRLEADFDSILETLKSSESVDAAPHVSRSDLEGALVLESSTGAEPGLEDAEVLEAPVEKPAELTPDTQPEPRHDDLSEMPKALGRKFEGERDGSFPAAERLAGISEERLEAIVTRVVEEVVERVARETMANIAEKVIRGAIDALRESSKSPNG
ncbi:MAG TPA: hypothetical protein VMW90_08830 [Acidobacteriota bacterium]|nr:hypothetical protein [Acidobacteriota bacterium]